MHAGAVLYVSYTLAAIFGGPVPAGMTTAKISTNISKNVLGN
jgi:hypothetical protein